ncbi:putative Nudix hydrolase NudL isoform X2 [Babylonia areolata]
MSLPGSGSRSEDGGGAVVSEEEVGRRLAVYDLRTNPRLAARHPPNQYPHTRRCAVLVPLFFSPSTSTSSPTSSRAELHVLLTLRSASLSFHADTVSLPGGAQDPSDEDDGHTALRETQEEVGLAPENVTIVAHLPPFFVGPNNSVFPVVGFIPPDFRPVPNHQEVARVFSVPLRDFVDRVTFSPYTALGRNMVNAILTHVVDGQALTVWGATCMLCVAVARAVLDPSRRLRLFVPGDGGAAEKEEEGGRGGFVGRKGDDDAADEDEDDDGGDDNVFGDLEKYYHKLCSASRPKGRL